MVPLNGFLRRMRNAWFLCFPNMCTWHNAQSCLIDSMTLALIHVSHIPIKVYNIFLLFKHPQHTILRWKTHFYYFLLNLLAFNIYFSLIKFIDVLEYWQTIFFLHNYYFIALRRHVVLRVFLTENSIMTVLTTEALRGRGAGSQSNT